MIGIAFGYDTAGCGQSDGCCGQIFNGRIRIDTVESRHRVFGFEFFPFDFCNHHFYCTMTAVFFQENILTNAAFQITFFFRASDFFFIGNFQRKRNHFLNRVTHAGRAVSGRYDVYRLFEHVCARVFLIHSCDCGDIQFILHGFGNRTGSNTVTACVKCRACDEKIRILAFHHFQDFRFGFFDIFSEVTIAADNGGYDLAFVTQCSVDCKAGSYRSFAQFRFHVGFFFAADTSVELIDIVNDS